MNILKTQQRFDVIPNMPVLLPFHRCLKMKNKSRYD